MIIAYLLLFHFHLIREFFSDYSSIQKFITPELKLPIFLSALFISVILSINPFAQLVPITSMISFFYGFKYGMIFAMLSVFISEVLTLYLSRNLGKKFVKRILGEKNWNKLNLLADEEGTLPFFIAHLFPVFPDSIVAWVAGTTNVPILRMAVIALIARIPGNLVTVLIGSGIVTKNVWLTAGLFITLVSTAFLMNKYRKKILAMMDRKKS